MEPRPSHSPYSLSARGQGIHQVLSAMAPVGSRVLDVGCAAGYFMELLRDRRDCSVLGIEPHEGAAEVARSRGLAVHQGTLDDVFTEVAAEGPFDVVVFADVLEHMLDGPEQLQKAEKLLAPGGTVLVSLPNIGYVKARARVASGRWRYEEHGIFDRTHVRFYTVDTAKELLTGAGYRIVESAFVGPLSHRLGHVGLRLNRLRPQILALQMAFRVAPA